VNQGKETTMKVFIAGGTGAVGKRLVPLLASAGHHVYATTRSAGKVDDLRRLGAEPVVLDILDREAVEAAIDAARPEAIVHQATALADMSDMRKFAQEFAQTDRLRIEGTDNLLAAALASGVRRVVAQSFTGWTYAKVGGPLKTEDDPLDADPPKEGRGVVAAIRHVEERVTGTDGLEGVVLRYGGFYGPGTSISEGGVHLEAIRKRKFPVVGSGAGLWSFVHIDDVASATKLAIESDVTGIFNIVDDEPAPVSEWLPYLAAAIGAKPPRHVPAWIGKLAVGELGLEMMTEARGASNEKAKRELGWELRYPSWRLGFKEGLVDAAVRGEALAV
jgi:2-alkyl-3-oxoalkanoate reductase